MPNESSAAGDSRHSQHSPSSQPATSSPPPTTSLTPPPATPSPPPTTSPTSTGQPAASAGARVSLDTAAFIGGYPFRYIPHPDADILVSVLDRESISAAWVGHLPGAFHRDPAPSNATLYAALQPHRDRLVAAPIVRPDWPAWRDTLTKASDSGARAIRAYPQLWGMPAGDSRLAALAEECARRSLTLLLTVRFEDLRQRHSLDVAGDLSAAHVRELARASTGARIVVSAAGREMIEEIHWGLTPDERALIFYDFGWVWGPPSDELAILFRAIGSDRFVYGTMWPLRLTQGARANLALLPRDLQSSALADPASW